jgi:hypothetical protein
MPNCKNQSINSKSQNDSMFLDLEFGFLAVIIWNLEFGSCNFYLVLGAWFLVFHLVLVILFFGDPLPFICSERNGGEFF